MSESLQLRGTLRGHNGWVTQIAINPKYPDMIISSSRGQSYFVEYNKGFGVWWICKYSRNGNSERLEQR